MGEAKQYALDSLKIFRNLGDPRWSELALEQLTHWDTSTGRLAEGKRWVREIWAICQEIGDRHLVARGLSYRGFVRFLSGEFIEARTLYEEAALIFDDLGVNDWMVPGLLTDVSLELGQYEYVRTEGERELAFHREQNLPRWVGEWLLKLGSVAVATESYGDAQPYLQEAVASLRDARLLIWLGFCLALQGVTYRALGEVRRAETSVLEALQLSYRTEHFFLQIRALSAAALCLIDRGEVVMAVELYALASRYPIVANSSWCEDVFGAEIAAISATLPREVVETTEERGQARGLYDTVVEIVGELTSDEPVQTALAPRLV
jgi:tetratricopeptide (TPR) repeat protein